MLENLQGTISEGARKKLQGAILDPQKVYGASAYEIAVKNGFQGTEEEWLASLYHTDTTLTQAGEAADAKVVGDTLKGKMDRVVTLDFTSGLNEDIMQGEQGISWVGECEIETNLNDQTEYVSAVAHNRMPIVAGDGIFFEVEKKQNQNFNYELLKITNTRDYSRDLAELRQEALSCFKQNGTEIILTASSHGEYIESLRRYKLSVDERGDLTTNSVPAEVLSTFDSIGYGVKDTNMFSWEERYGEAVIDAVEHIVDDNGVQQEPGFNSHYIKYDEIAAGTGTLPPHVYCNDNSSQYLRYLVYIKEAGIYKLTANLRIKDAQLRGATYTINKGTEQEHSFVTAHKFYKDEYAHSVCDSTQGSWMFGDNMKVFLHAGINSIRITPSAEVTKNQHFRNLILSRVANLPEEDDGIDVTVDEAEEIGISLPKGARQYEPYYMFVTFNNGAPRESDGFCRVITSNGHLMSIKNIILEDGQTMPTEGSTVEIRGKLGCVNSVVNGGIGKEARIFDAHIIAYK